MARKSRSRRAGGSGGRGDGESGGGGSALARRGQAPRGVAAVEHWLRDRQGDWRGEEVPFEAGGDVDALALAGQPTSSRLSWLDPNLPKVPVDVAATGPRVIAAAARHADRVSFNVGADVERVRWGMDLARAARQEAGLSPEISFAVYLTLVTHRDPQ